MYSTYYNEMLKLTGKKQTEERISMKESNQQSEIEVIKQVEQILREKRHGGRINNHISGSFVDDHNSSFHKDIQMLSLIKKDKENRSKKTTELYPLDYYTYKKNLETKKKIETDIADSHSLILRHDDVPEHPLIKRGVNKRKLKSLEHPLLYAPHKSKYYDKTDSRWKKYEYRHPGNFVF